MSHLASRTAAVNQGLRVSREILDSTPLSSRCPSDEQLTANSSRSSVFQDPLNSNAINDSSQSLMTSPRSQPSANLTNRISKRNANSQIWNKNLNSNQVLSVRPRTGMWNSAGETDASPDGSSPISDNMSDSEPASAMSPDATEDIDVLSLAFDANGNNNTCLYRMPIVGYEVLEERSRFTIFKIQVEHQPSGEMWFVFRRYTDFVRLNKQLRVNFPGLRFALPPKRWFGDNFDTVFLEDRQLGLQAFIDNIIGHTKIRDSESVRSFFCLDDPPGPHDSLEESRALCLSLEETIIHLQDQLKQKDGELNILKSQVNFLMTQQHTLVKALRLECELNSSQDDDPESTHQLNLALLNICEKTLSGVSDQQSNSNRSSTRLSIVSSPVKSSTNTSMLRRTLERAFIPNDNN